MRRAVGFGALAALLALIIAPVGTVSAAGPTAAPGAPTGLSATAGTLAATVTWSPSGQLATSFTVTSNPGGITATVDGSVKSATVTGLGFGLAYRFTVQGVNAIGAGPSSAASNAVNPLAPGGQYQPGIPLVLFSGDVAAGHPLAVSLGEDPVAVPGLSAVVVNVTASNATTPSAVQLVVNQQVVDTVIAPVGQVDSNLAFVAIPPSLSQAALSVTAGTVHVELAFVGFITGPGRFRNHGGMLRPIQPAVLFDGAVTAGSSTHIPVLGQGDVPATNVSEVLVNVTASGSAAAGSLALEPSGLPAWFPPPPMNLGFAAGETTANRAIIAVGSDGAIALLDKGAAASVHVEAIGWFTSSTDPTALGALFSPAGPARLVDSAASGGPVAAGSSITFAVRGQGGVPASNSTAPPTGAVFQVSAVSPQGAGSISFAGSPAVDFTTGQTTSGLVISPLANDGSASFSVSGAATNVTIDLVGYLSGDLIVPGTTKKLSAGLLAGITSLTDASITFAAGVQASPPIILNDVINAGLSPTTPYGFLRRVLAISTSSTGETVVATRNASLPEALTAYSVSWTEPRRSGAFSAFSSSPGLSRAATASLPPFQPPPGTSIDPGWPVLTLASNVHQLVFPVSASFSSLSGDLTVTDLELQMVPHVQFGKNPFTNPQFAFAMSMGMKFEADASILGTIASKTWTPFDKEYTTKPPDVIPAGPIEIIVQGVIESRITVDLTLQAGVKVTIKADKYGIISGGYDNGSFFGNTRTFDYVPPDQAITNPLPTLQAEIRPGLHLIGGVLFYGFAKVAGDKNPYFRFTVDPLANPWWDAAVGVCGHLIIGIDFTQFLINIRKEASIDFPCEEFIVGHAPGPFVNITIMPSPATVPRSGTLHFTETTNPVATGVLWSIVDANGGSLSNATLTAVDYTAPSRAGKYHLQAASLLDPTSTRVVEITVTATAPGPPQNVTAQPAPSAATVTWTAPTDDGGASVNAYHVAVSPGGAQVDTGNVLSATVPNLTPGSTYTFTVTATNTAGLTSAPSAASAPVTIPNPIPDQVIVTPQNTDFGLVPAGQSVTQTLTVHASSTAAITINSLLPQAGAGLPLDFAIPASTDTCTGTTVPAGGTCTFQVVYVAAAEGYSFVSVYVYYNTPTLVVSAFLSGHAPLPVVGGFKSVTDAQVLDLQHGWAMDGARGMWAMADGKTWTQQVAPAGASFQYRFRFADALQGLALGCAATGPGACAGFDTAILGTSNGGATWTTLSSIPNLESRGIWFDKDGVHAWVIGADFGSTAAMYASADAGLTWVRQSLPDPEAASCVSAGNFLSSDISEVRFIDHLNGWAFGSSECQQSGSLAVLSQLTLAWSTADGGANWTAHDTGLNTFFIFPNSRLQVLSAGSLRVAVKVGTASPVILATDNGGLTFRQVPLPDAARDLSYLDSNNAVLITGTSGRTVWTVWTSTNDGITWTKTPALLPGLIRTLGNNMIGSYGLLETVDATHWWAFGQIAYGDGSPVAGVIVASADASSSWRTQAVGDGT